MLKRAQYAAAGIGGSEKPNVVRLFYERCDAFRIFTWGTDLSGSLQGAGGIGGLLASLDTAGTNAPGSGPGGANPQTPPGPNYQTIAARYEYDPYGNNALDPLNASQSGNYAATNAFRFSTKPFDAETGLSYFGYRYYAPGMGRWMNRDPLGHEGGLNLYGYVENSPMDFVDPFGLEPWEVMCARKCGLTQDVIALFPEGTTFYPLGEGKFRAHLWTYHPWTLSSDKSRWLGSIDFSYAEREHCAGEKDASRLVASLEAGRAQRNADTSCATRCIVATGKGAEIVVSSVAGFADTAADCAEFIENPSWQNFAMVVIPVAGVRCVDDVADGGKKIASRGSDAAEESAERAVLEAATGCAKRTPCAELRPYGGKGGGHHIPARIGFEGAKNYNCNKAPAIPNSWLKEHGIDHDVISGVQHTRYVEFRKCGRKLTFEEMEKIEIDALKCGGMPDDMARETVKQAIEELKRQGVDGPTRIPWDR